MAKNTEEKYADIITLPHHVSDTRPRMSKSDRAAQFSAFAALTGFDSIIGETGRYTEAQIELDDSRKLALNEKIRILSVMTLNPPQVEITYFRPDERKHGGAYLSTRCRIIKVDDFARVLLTEDKCSIPIDSIVDIQSEILSCYV